MKIMFKESLKNQVFNLIESDLYKSESIKVGCSNCKVREQCLPKGLSPREVARFDALVIMRLKVRRGAALVRRGDKFNSVYAIRTGFLKTHVTLEDGREQVTGFLMAGEMIGLDGLATERHIGDALALEDSEVCVMPFDRLVALAREVNALQQHVHKLMSREIVRVSGVMLLLGSMRSEERVAALLLDLTRRLSVRGFSPSELILRMTRDEIGSYLSLKLETVSRAFTKFAAEGILDVRQRHIQILDRDALEEVAMPGRSSVGASRWQAGSIGVC